MAQEFISKLEEIMPAEELLFNPTPAFGKYRAIMPEEAVRHPAKFNTNLVEFLIKTYTKPGDVILDCMAGTGILGVIAALHGRHAIQVEIEEKFFRWMEKARENVEKLSTLMPKGKIINICGDARRLSELLSQVDTIITSPPYSETLSVGAGGGSKKNALGVGITSDGKPQAQGAPIPYSMNPDNIGNLPLGNIDTIITSPPFGDTNLSGGDPEKRRERLLKAGYDPKDFLGGKARNAVLKHYNEVDTIITSPPYLDVDNVKRNSEDFWLKAKELGKRWGSKPPAGTEEKQLSKNNIGNLPLGNIDVIITSPPYSDCKKGGEASPEEIEKYARRWEENYEKHGWNSWGKNSHTPGRLRGIMTLMNGYSENKENIGNLPLGNIDCCIMSPPYESSLEGSSRHTRGGIASRDPALAQSGTYATVTSSGIPICYSPNPENIGNLKSSDEEYEALVKGLMTKDGKPTYLSEMFKVYREIWKVLKPGGLAIIVVKPFQRQHKIIDLPYHTFLLMRRCGFVLERLYKLRLKHLSFWRILAYKKNPNIPQIRHEYVLVMEKRSLLRY